MIITRYITREILRPFAFICGVLLLLMISYSALVLFADAESNLIPADLLIVLIISKTIAAFELFFPLALYITLLLGLGKLYSEQEISALQASGMSVFGLMKSLMPLIISITLLTAVVAIFVRPWAYELRYAAKYQAQKTFDFEHLEEGYFYENKESGQVYFVREIDVDNDVKKDIFIYQSSDDALQTIYSQQGYTKEGSDKLSPVMVFSNGTAHQIVKSGVDTLIKFNQFVIEPKNKQIAPPSFKRKAASTQYLSESRDKNEQAEFQWRVTSGFKAFLLAITAILLAKTSPRQGRYGKLVLGSLFFFVIHAGSLVMKAWVEQGVLSTMPGLWSIVIILLIISSVLTKRYS